ncbi:MAG TPA: dihydroxyacetone kinase subunit DhaL [Candidatus Limnocylindrales bacterium]|nr:dihydroxyacetone kinase subunit DhaL [Candidatus Limnocylindrales bacterium]
MPSLRTCALAAADALEAARDELCRLDSGAGDADHGVTMALAARAVRQSLHDSPDAAGADLMMRLAAAMGSVGGASGPLYAAALLAGAGVIRRRAPAAAPSVAMLREGFDAAADAITKLGGARPGDKTMLDALDPAALSLHQAPDEGVGEALRTAAIAARTGAEGTASMTARAGRAARLGERSRGMADPGATSVALILEAVATAYSSRT